MVKKFSYSQALLAFAIAFLALSIFKFTTQVPAMLVTIDKATELVDSLNPKVDKILNEVAQVRKLVLEKTPQILSRIDSTLPVVQQVVLESESYSRQLPALLAEITKIEQQIAAIQNSMPAILKRVDAVVKTTDGTTKEIARWRPHSTQYLKEIALSRDYIPQYLLRLENTVIDAKTIGSAASSGLVSGFFKGVFNLPFEMVSGLTDIVEAGSKSAKYLKAEDIALMQEKVLGLLNNSSQSTAVWQNVQTGNRGMIVKGKKSTHKGDQCMNVTFKNYFSDDKETLKELMCVDDEGLWRVI